MADHAAQADWRFEVARRAGAELMRRWAEEDAAASAQRDGIVIRFRRRLQRDRHKAS